MPILTTDICLVLFLYQSTIAEHFTIIHKWSKQNSQN